jgi:aureolysin
MKKFWACTMSTCTLLPLSTNFANGAEQSQTSSVTAIDKAWNDVGVLK